MHGRTRRTPDGMMFQPRRFGSSILLAGVGLVTVLIAWPVLVHAVEAWRDSEDLHFAFVIPPITVALLWWHRRALRQNANRGSWHGLLVVGFGLAAFFGFERLWATTPQAIAVGILIWGIAVSLWGWRVGRILAFPVAWLTYGLALQRTLVAPFAFLLQDLTTAGAFLLTSRAALPVTREGLVLRIDDVSFEVAEPCSGMSALLALLALAGLLLYLLQGSPWRRSLVLLAVLPLVVAANTLRITLVVIIAHALGPDVAMEYFHGLSSVVLFSVAVGGLLGISWLAGCRRPAWTT